MEKKQIVTIIKRSTVALIIPILGALFVNGWSWGVLDFVFAWVFFNILGVTYTFVTNKIASRGWRIVVGILVIALFAFVWIRLATG